MRMLRYIQCPYNVFELLVQVFVCNSILFFSFWALVICQYISAAMEFLFKHSPHLNNCTVGDVVPHSVHDLD